MANAMRDYVKSQVLGTQDVKLAETLVSLEKERQRLLKISDKNVYYLLTYSPVQQKNLINAVLLKYGRITFYNSNDRVVKIVAADSVAFNKNKGGDDVLLTCAFVFNGKVFTRKPWLTTMLADGSTFVPNIAKTVADRLKELDTKITSIKKKLAAEAAEVKAQYAAEMDSYDKIEQEATTGRKIQLSNAEAVAVAHKSRERIKNIEQVITIKEKETLLRWICKNIFSIKIYGLLDGQSGKALKNNYADVSGIHYRSPKYNEEGKVVSQDSISGELYFDTTKDAPEEILRKVCSNKRGDTLFKGALSKRLCDKNLALYLLAEYSKYGFAAGVKHLNKQIDAEALLGDEFGNN